AGGLVTNAVLNALPLTGALSKTGTFTVKLSEGMAKELVVRATESGAQKTVQKIAQTAAYDTMLWTERRALGLPASSSREITQSIKEIDDLTVKRTVGMFQNDTRSFAEEMGRYSRRVARTDARLVTQEARVNALKAQFGEGSTQYQEALKR